MSISTATSPTTSNSLKTSWTFSTSSRGSSKGSKRQHYGTVSGPVNRTGLTRGLFEDGRLDGPICETSENWEVSVGERRLGGKKSKVRVCVPKHHRKLDVLGTIHMQAREPMYTLYVTTPTSNLTLARSISQIADLDTKVTHQVYYVRTSADPTTALLHSYDPNCPFTYLQESPQSSRHPLHHPNASEMCCKPLRERCHPTNVLWLP